MIPYYIIFFYFGVLAFFEYWCRNGILNKFFLYISFFLLLIFYGLRFDVGIDWSVYYSFYEQVEPLGVVFQGVQEAPVFFSVEFSPLDIGYRILNSIFKSLGIGFQGLIFLISLFNIFSLCKFIEFYELKFKFTFILIFISLSMFREFDVFRQSLSFYIFLFSLRYIDANIFKYIFINILGSFFHLGVLMLILMIPVLRMKFSRNQLIIIAFFYIFTMFFPLPLISITLTVAELISLPPWLLVRMVAMHEYLNYPRELGLTISIPCIFLMGMVILKYNIYRELDRHNSMLMNIFFCYLLIGILGSEINEFVTRFGYYFFIGIALAFSFVPIFIGGVSRLLISILPLVFAVAKLFLMMENPAANATYAPYTNYLFENEEDRFLNIEMKKSVTSDYYADK